MRELHLFANRKGQPKSFVEGLNSANPVTELRETQGDTIAIFVHQYDANPATRAVTAFVEKPLTATAVRASIGDIDAPPERGMFQLKVGANITSALAWPSDLSTAELIAAWKTAVLAALNALASVTTLGGLRLDDPAGTPANFFYLTWIDPTVTTAIEVMQNRLVPWIRPTVTPGVIPVGFSQLVKLARFPLRMSGEFVQATTPPILIIETVPGATGTNEEQTIVVPSGASSSFALSWSGVSTATLAVGTVTAASIAAALNAIVADGATNPSFAVVDRSTGDDGRFAVTFIGPLAGAARALLGFTMRDQQGAPWWVGTMVLDGLGVEMELNGAAEATTTFELVITDEGEETYLVPFVIENDMTDPGTGADAAEAGAVVVVERTIYVDTSTGSPTLRAAPGYTFTPGAAGDALVITHGLNTWRPKVELTLYAVDHTIFAADPTDLDAATTGSRLLKQTEYGETATTANILHIALPWELVADPASDYDYRLLKVDVSSPDAVLTTWGQLTTWDLCKDTLPGGQTVREKFAALLALITSLGGGITINGNVIQNGTISPPALDLTALAVALFGNAQFVALLRAFASDTTFISNLVNALTTNSALTSIFNSLITSVLNTIIASTDLLTVFSTLLVKSFTDNETINNLINTNLITILQGGSLAPDSIVLFAAPDWTPADLPPLNTVLSGSAVLATLYSPLPIAYMTTTTGSTITGDLAATGTAGELRAVVGSAEAVAMNGRAAQYFSDGAIILWNGRFWQQVAVVDSVWYPAEYEEVIFTQAVNAEQLSAGTQLVCLCQLALQLTTDPAPGRRTTGLVKLVVEHAQRTVTAGGHLNISGLTFTEAAALTLPLASALDLHRVEIKVMRASGGTITATLRKYLQAAATITAPASADFVLRGRLTQWDVENVTDPAGSYHRAASGIRCSIAALPA